MTDKQAGRQGERKGWIAYNFTELVSVANARLLKTYMKGDTQEHRVSVQRDLFAGEQRYLEVDHGSIGPMQSQMHDAAIVVSKERVHCSVQRAGSHAAAV